MKPYYSIYLIFILLSGKALSIIFIYLFRKNEKSIQKEEGKRQREAFRQVKHAVELMQVLHPLEVLEHDWHLPEVLLAKEKQLVESPQLVIQEFTLR